jgi:hypothetical protein
MKPQLQPVTGDHAPFQQSSAASPFSLAMTLALRNLGFHRVPDTQVALLMRPL